MGVDEEGRVRSVCELTRVFGDTESDCAAVNAFMEVEKKIRMDCGSVMWEWFHEVKHQVPCVIGFLICFSGDGVGLLFVVFCS